MNNVLSRKIIFTFRIMWPNIALSTSQNSKVISGSVGSSEDGVSAGHNSKVISGYVGSAEDSVSAGHNSKIIHFTTHRFELSPMYWPALRSAIYE